MPDVYETSEGHIRKLRGGYVLTIRLRGQGRRVFIDNDGAVLDAHASQVDPEILRVARTLLPHVDGGHLDTLVATAKMTPLMRAMARQTGESLHDRPGE